MGTDARCHRGGGHTVTDLRCHRQGNGRPAACHRRGGMDTAPRCQGSGDENTQTHGMSPGNGRGPAVSPGGGTGAVPAAPPRGSEQALRSPRSRCHSGATCARPARPLRRSRKAEHPPPPLCAARPIPERGVRHWRRASEPGRGRGGAAGEGGAILEAALRTSRSGRAVRPQGQRRLPTRRRYAVCVASPKMAARSSSAVAGARAVAAARPGARAGVRRAKGGSA